MATIIQIKRAQTSETPTGLANGELAYSYAGDKLFIGQTTTSGSPVTNEIIGGHYFTNIIDHAHGTLTANSALIADTNSHINNIKVANLQLQTSGGSSNGIIGVQNDSSMSSTNNSTLVTSASIKNYVDTQTTLNNSFTIDTDEGTSNNFILTANPTLAVLGNSSQGIVTKQYTSNSVIMIRGKDATTSQKGVASFNTNHFNVSSGAVTIKPDGITNAQLANSFLQFSDGANTQTANLGQDIRFSGTTNETEVTVRDLNVQVGLPQDVTIARNLTVTNDLNVTNNLVVSANLTVAGTLAYLNTTTLAVSDPLIFLANNNTSGDTVDIGFAGQYNDGTNRVAGVFRDANDQGKFKFFDNLTEIPGNAVNTSDASFQLADVELNNLEVNQITLNQDLGVTMGGTGANTFTSNGILYGNGTGALQVTAAGAEGKVLQAGSGGTPEFGDLDGGSF